MKKVILIFMITILSNFILLHGYNNYLEKFAEYPTSGVYCEKDNQVTIFPYLYYTTNYGLEIYEIDSVDSLKFISRLPLLQDARSINIKNNYAYVITIAFKDNYYTILKIDISDPNNPIIVDDVTFYNEENYAKGYIFGDYYITKYNDENYNHYLKVIKIPELQYVDDYQYSGAPFIQLNDSTAIKYYSNNLFNLYDFSDPTNISQINQLNLSGTGLETPSNFKSLNDTLVVAVSNNGLSFWNMSDFSSWNLISVLQAPPNTWWGENICYDGVNLLFLPQITTRAGVVSINVSEITNPYIIDNMNFITPVMYFYYSNTDISCGGNYIFIGKWSMINQFKHSAGVFTEQFEIYNNLPLNEALLHSNYLFTSCLKGMIIYNIDSPSNMEKVNSILIDNNIGHIISEDTTLALIDYDEKKIKLFSIVDPSNPNFMKSISANFVSDYDEILFNNNDDNIYYVSEYPNAELRKYDISQPGAPNLEFSYDLGTGGNGFIYNDHFYYLAKYDNSSDLKIIGGITSNTPEVITNIENFIPESTLPYMHNSGDYFYVYDRHAAASSNFPLVYQISNITDINYKFTSNRIWNGPFVIHDNILIANGSFSNLYAYDLEGNESLKKPPIEIYEDFGASLGCLLYEQQNNERYLYHLQRTAVSVYEIKEQGINPGPNNNKLLTSHPNPFTNSTTISFTSKKLINENNKIEIYNIKGQKVKNLNLNEEANSKNGYLSYSAIWDGKNESKQKVAPGIYFCKIKTAENTFVSKMLRVE